MPQTKTITVRYVNDPKTATGPGSIKDTEGYIWQVWPDKLEQFRGAEGSTFQVTYQSKTYNGRRQHTIITARPLADAPPAFPGGPPSAARGHSLAASSNDSNKSVEIAVLSLSKCLPHWFAKLPPGDAAGLEHVLKSIRIAWRGLIQPTITTAARPSLAEELNDEIPGWDEPAQSSEQQGDDV